MIKGQLLLIGNDIHGISAKEEISAFFFFPNKL
jgi:hypothetical protein